MWSFPARTVPLSHLSHPTFDGVLEHKHVLADLLRDGHHLESLRLSLTVRALTPAPLCAQRLRAHISDSDSSYPSLYPAPSYFLRERPRLAAPEAWWR